MTFDLRSVWVVTRREFLERVQKKSFLIFTLLTPLLFGGMMILPVAFSLIKSEKVNRVMVMDHTGWMEPLLKKAEEPKTKSPAPDPNAVMKEDSERYGESAAQFIFPAPGDSLESLKAQVEAKTLDGVLVLEPDAEKDARATFYGVNLGNPQLMTFLERRLFKAALEHRLVASGVDPSLAEKLQSRIPVDGKKVEKGGKTKEGSFLGEYLKAMMLCMLLYMLIIIYGTALMRGVMEERNGKIAEVVLSSVKPFEWMLGKIVGIASVGLFQFAIWFAMGAGLAFANPLNFVNKAGSAMLKPTEMILIVVYFLLGFFFYGSMYAAVGAMCSSEQEAQQVQTPVIMFLVLPMLLLGLVLQNPDALWLQVLSFIPLFTPTLMMVRVSIIGVPLWQIIGSIASLLVGIVIMAFLAGRIFRVGILMTGKRPTIPEIWRWIRAG
jgi:ABC-2 type transport system permease protein